MSIGQNVYWTVQDNVYKSVSGKAEGKRERKGYSELQREHRLYLRRATSALIQLTAILQEYRHALSKLFYSRKCKRIRFLCAIIRHCQLTQLRKWATLSPKQKSLQNQKPPYASYTRPAISSPLISISISHSFFFLKQNNSKDLLLEATKS